jgi:hypothetical protein
MITEEWVSSGAWYKKLAQNSNLRTITEKWLISGTIFCTIVIISLAAMLSRRAPYPSVILPSLNLKRAFMFVVMIVLFCYICRLKRTACY